MQSRRGTSVILSYKNLEWNGTVDRIGRRLARFRNVLHAILNPRSKADIARYATGILLSL